MKEHIFNEISKRGRFIGTESKLVVTRALGKERMENHCLMFTEFLSGVMKKVLETDTGDGCITL